MACRTARAVSQGFLELNDVKAPRRFILIAENGSRVPVQRELLECFAYFQNLLNSDPELMSHKIETSHEMLLIFRGFLTGEPIRKYPDGYLMLRFALTIRQEAFTKWCIANIREFNIAADSSEDEVITIVGEIVRQHTLRQARDYRPLADAVRLWAGGNFDRRNHLLNYIATVIAQKGDEISVLAGVPLFSHELTVALLRTGPRNALQVAVYRRETRIKWVPFDPLGPYFDVSIWNDVNQFYLVPFNYIVYLKSDNCIYLLDLKRAAQTPRLLLSS